MALQQQLDAARSARAVAEAERSTLSAAAQSSAAEVQRLASQLAEVERERRALRDKLAEEAEAQRGAEARHQKERAAAQAMLQEMGASLEQNKNELRRCVCVW